MKPVGYPVFDKKIRLHSGGRVNVQNQTKGDIGHVLFAMKDSVETVMVREDGKVEASKVVGDFLAVGMVN